jgi:hypothetical protein
MADGMQGAGSAGDIVYSGTYTNGIVLNNPATQNPTTIAATSLVTNSGTAILGEAGTAWTVANYGMVEAGGTNPSVIGIDLAGGGLVVNGAGGLIANTATPSVFGAVAITGSATYGAAGTVTNHGTIAGGARISFPTTYYYSNPTLGIVLNTGTIAGSNSVDIIASDGTVLNYGRITGTSLGVSITYVYPGEVDHSSSVGTVVNSGVIAGKKYSVEAAAYVVNYGTLNGGLYGGGEFDDGVLALTNYGIVHARETGVAAQTLANYGMIRSIGTQAAYSFGQVTNYGVIADPSGNGLLLGGGSLINGQYGVVKGGETGVLLHSFKSLLNPGYADSITNYGTITGSVGVEIDGSVPATLVNAGTIIGTGGTAVSFVNSGDVLVTEPGAVFVGTVAGDPSTLELAAGARPGTLTGLGANFTDFPDIAIAPAADWVFTDMDPDAATAVTIGNGATAEFAGPVGNGQSVTFTGSAGALKLDAAGSFAGTIAGFGAGDSIDLLHSAADGLSFAGGQLMVTNQGVTVADLAFAGSYKAVDFALSPDGNSGTEIVFAAGTAGLVAMKG